MTLDKNQIEQSLFDYIGKNTLYDVKNLTAQTLLFRDGVFDSMGFILLVEFLEENFGIKTNDNDLVEENFESVSAIASFIRKKRTANAA
jgi:acyl carrier protein